tara:strand:+ start:6958 stop:7707 length:750 start_codon:yes stop_codon:yes gene_type:complete
MIKRLIKGNEEIIYSSEAEFKKYEDEEIHENWRKAPKGAWIKTDNGKVVRVLARNSMVKRDKVYDFIRTPYGQFICEDHVTINGEPKTNIYTFSGKSWYESINDRENPTKKEFLFAKYYANGAGAVDAYIKAYDTGSVKNAKEKSNLLLKQKRIQNLINDEMQKALDETEISPTYLLERMKGIVDDMEANNRDKIQSIKILMQVSGMLTPEKKTESLTVFQGFSQEQLQALKQDRPKELAHAERTIETT